MKRMTSARRGLSLIVATCGAGFLALVAGYSAPPATVTSPNGKIKVEIQADALGQLTWSVKRLDRTVLAPRAGRPDN